MTNPTVNYPFTQTSPNTIGLIHNQSIEIVVIANILRCSAASNSTIFHLTCGTRIRTCKTLLFYVEYLQPFGFSRFNRSELVNLSYIKKITKDQLILTDGSTVNLPLKRNKAFKDFVQSVLSFNDDKIKNQGRFPSGGRKRKTV